MISPRLVNCVNCNTIPNLIDSINCKLTDLAKRDYNNIVFTLNYPKNNILWFDLLNYKRILEYKHCNPEYAGDYTTESIASKVRVLIYK